MQSYDYLIIPEQDDIEGSVKVVREGKVLFKTRLLYRRGYNDRINQDLQTVTNYFLRTTQFVRHFLEAYSGIEYEPMLGDLIIFTVRGIQYIVKQKVGGCVFEGSKPILGVTKHD
jgi:hypothetical protein